MDYSNSFSPEMMGFVADTQGAIFEYAEKQGYNMLEFITDFMYSDFCNHEMDSESSYFHYKSGSVCFSYVKNEIALQKANPDDLKMYDSRWIGKMYRLLVFATGKPSSEIVSIIGPRRMNRYSVSLELYNLEDAVKEILRNSRI